MILPAMHSVLKQSKRVAARGCARKLLAIVIIPALAFISEPSRAASEEIQVYMDDLTAPGNFGADIHNNYVLSGNKTPAFDGAQPPNHVYRLTPEFYYGVTNTFELGLYVLSSVGPDNGGHLDGSKLRAKYIAPHDEKQGDFWGVNLEVGKTNVRVSETPWNAQLKGIYGRRSGRWTFAVNPNIDWSLSSSVYNSGTLEVDTKLAYRTDGDYQLGFESYNELGPLRHPGHLNEQSQTLYVAIDTEVGGFDLNAGLGRGLTDASDRWVVKFIVGVHY